MVNSKVKKSWLLITCIKSLNDLITNFDTFQNLFIYFTETDKNNHKTVIKNTDFINQNTVIQKNTPILTMSIILDFLLNTSSYQVFFSYNGLFNLVVGWVGISVSLAEYANAIPTLWSCPKLFTMSIPYIPSVPVYKKIT